MRDPGILHGVKVLDLSRVLAGPYCTMMLADMGANVVKIETPGEGDDSRRSAPSIEGGESAYYINLNRNKRGVTLNLKTPSGKKIFRRLAETCDILVENFRPGVMEKLGFGYEELRKINPAIVYGAISGFGHFGPYAQRAGYDIIAQAMSGLMSVTGWPDSGPTRTGTAIGDVVSGLSCAVGILAAYINRLKTGKGEKVDVALVDSMVSSLEIINMIYLCTGRVPARIGNRYEAVYPYDSFRAADGDVIIACGNDKLYGLLSQVLGLPSLRGPLFADNPLRVKNHAQLKAVIEEWTAGKTVGEVVEALLAAGIPAAPIHSIDQVAADPHIAGAREMFVDCDHPAAGKVKLTGSHLKFTDHGTTEYRPAPLLGQHTKEVLAEAGFTGAEIEAFGREGAI